MQEIMQYIPGDGIFHRVHPFTKLLFTIIIVLLAVLTSDLILLAVLLLVVFLAAWAAGLGRGLTEQIPLLLVLGLMLVLFTVLTMHGGEVIFTLIPSGIPFIGGALPVTTGALLFGTILSLRFAVMLFAFQLLVVSTKPGELVTTLRQLKMPIDYTLMFLIALRFIPTLQREGIRISEAQLARGYSPGDGMMGKIRGLRPVILPLILNSLGKADTLGLTIDMRGYRRGRAQTEKIVFGSLDAIVILSAVALAAVIAGVQIL
ncbi:energy-coupling factor transporter transmembrane protein EcfT [Methanocalculus sp.]|uniref:energy-coupling factor transporter transmembrane component T family protein n=1 Tax=Methanocalculus sp. TaxID=2004547 RepID=UPI00271951FF|nr:energy-coupling factor transporter transmembrane component T [Methanocalculus sp.]MDO8841137.1 energy-coupling factor transporter transmembrane component T [Methanocalculus sp.]